LEFGRIGYFEPGYKVSRCRLDLLRVYSSSGGEPDCHAGQQCQREFMLDLHERSPRRSGCSSILNRPNWVRVRISTIAILGAATEQRAFKTDAMCQ
jgi:hypothetical protein